MKKKYGKSLLVVGAVALAVTLIVVFIRKGGEELAAADR